MFEATRLNCIIRLQIIITVEFAILFIIVNLDSWVQLLTIKANCVVITVLFLFTISFFVFSR
jgi:hypothetical protein